jgi:dihydroflavonol-4-reductase
MTCALVTGGNGFIGRHLVSELATRGRRLRVLDLRGPGRALPDIDYFEGSVLDADLVDQALNGVDEVYHLAALPGMWEPNKADFHDVNYRGTEIVMAAARKHGVSRFLHCSTESILFRSARAEDYAAEDCSLTVDQMPGLYTRSKMLADQLAMQAAASGFPVVVACPTMPIGPHDHNLTPPAAMLRHFLAKGRLQMFLDFIVNLVDVRDVATGLVLAMEQGRTGHRYILGGECLPLKKILELMNTASGRRKLFVPVPGRLAEIVAAVLEFYADHVTRRAPLATVEGVRIAMWATALSSEKAHRELGYSPRPVEPALRETIAHLLDGRFDARILKHA